MKFAKELEQGLVPEWRAKYLDYKLGKKKVKAVARAERNVSQTPKTPGRRRPENLFASASYQLPIQSRSPFHESVGESILNSQTTERTPLSVGKDVPQAGKTTATQTPGSSAFAGNSTTYYNSTPPATVSDLRPLKEDDDEEERSQWGSGTVINYGSIIQSPPYRNPVVGPPMLELPGPALSPDAEPFPRHHRAWRQSKLPYASPSIGSAGPAPHDKYAGERSNARSTFKSALVSKQRKPMRLKRAATNPDAGFIPQRSPFLKRMFSIAGSESSASSDVPLEAYREFDVQQANFFNFLDSELDKIEKFYRMKEVEATNRLSVLRQQLHQMRDRRVEEVRIAQLAKEQAEREQHGLGLANGHGNDHEVNKSKERLLFKGFNWMKPIEKVVGIGTQHFGKNTRALEQLGTPRGLDPQEPSRRRDSWRDFTRRPIYHDEVPYRLAKKKLKLALQEYYRGLELLKSYALLNRTAFRKINKKYDKVVKARPAGRYVSEKVNKAWFVQSEVLDGHIVAVEDLYARYFERGNHKIAVSKLRSKHSRDESYNSSVFRNGFLLAAALVFGIQGLVYGSERLYDSNPLIRLHTDYLLQIYAGYFLALFLFLLFCLDCMIWARAKINYVFIFEFDSRHNLDWRQLSELPCFFLLLLGLALWLNFQHSGAGPMYLYWPIVLIGITIIILFFPGPVLYHRSREWWAYSNFRLLLAGLYPVEFRDFFLGDMYCSQTYALGNLELFFCLYARGWDDPSTCSSASSRLLGFFTTVPGIWRALQCLRRYYDTRNAFPHLVNCGKYTFTILFFMSLSLYRVSVSLPSENSTAFKAFFIVCATINSFYCSVWDLAMDWSLGNPYAKRPFLRDVLGYRHPWVYYLAMIIDPLLRFNWIFYAIFANELQHSAILSFCVGFSEVFRRAVWTLFRVENEHCTNVGRFRASRDVPLPYDIPSEEISPVEEEDTESQEALSKQASKASIARKARTTHPSRSRTTSNVDLESVLTRDSMPDSSFLRRRKTLPPIPLATPLQRGIVRVGTMMAEAHAQDFERKRRPGVTGKTGDRNQHHESLASSDEDEEDEDPDNQQDLIDANNIVNRHQSGTEES